jgi:AraC-like DNA-binding protein
MKEQNDQLAIMHIELNKRGRKGSVSEVARRAGVHRNTVRRILKGLGGKSIYIETVFAFAEQVLAEIEQRERAAAEIIEKRIARMRASAAA